MLQLNERAATICAEMETDQEQLRIGSRWLDCGTAILDCGIDVAGGLEAGRRLAEVCLAGLGDVAFSSGDARVWGDLWVQVTTDHPIAACLASQYAGWELKDDRFFAMGSGPMRAVAAHEPLFDEIGYRENARRVVGVLECDSMPSPSVCNQIAQKCGLAPERITLLVAPVTSQAGVVQVVSRSVETALHKLHELKFDLTRVESGWGFAPLPPVSGTSIAGIGRTNDAILYGARVTLYVRGDDASLRDVGPRIPSASSQDYGRPFAEVFARYDHDFYRIDPQLFSPAVVTLANLDTGNSFTFGEAAADVLAASFGRQA